MSKGYDIFCSQLDEAIVTFPGLQKAIVEKKEILKGTLQVIDKEGNHWEDYEVEIHHSDNFPFKFPLLFEVSDKIPKIADWHVYEDTLACCIKVQPEEIFRCIAGITVTNYIREEVMPYLFNQTHRRVKGFYVNGEYSHGMKGIYEFYMTALKTGNDIKKTVQLMQYIATHERPGRTSLCFCGKKTKFRHCHRGVFDKLKKIGDEVLQGHAYGIAKFAGLINM